MICNGGVLGCLPQLRAIAMASQKVKNQNILTNKLVFGLQIF